MVTPSKKTILIPLLAGASLLALQFASDAKHQSNVERKIESLTGAKATCYGKQPVTDVACFESVTLLCTAALAEEDKKTGKMYRTRDFVRQPTWKLSSPGNAARYYNSYEDCPLGYLWRCTKFPTSVTGGSWEFVRRETVSEKFISAISLDGVCKEDK